MTAALANCWPLNRRGFLITPSSLAQAIDGAGQRDRPDQPPSRVTTSWVDAVRAAAEQLHRGD